MTPLIDMAMLLIVFFVLVSQIGATDLVPMKLPKPSPSAASSPGREPRCVVNALSDGKGRVRAWRFAGQGDAPGAGRPAPPRLRMKRLFPQPQSLLVKMAG